MNLLGFLYKKEYVFDFVPKILVFWDSPMKIFCLRFVAFFVVAVGEAMEAVVPPPLHATTNIFPVYTRPFTIDNLPFKIKYWPKILL